VTIRPATSADAELLHDLICALAAYEREPDAVEATPAQLREQLACERPPFECVVAEWDGSPAGMALFFPNYSTWRGRPGLYLEDLFVRPEYRGRGIGRALLHHLAHVAHTRGYARMEWSVLDWNAPAIGFYRRLGAAPMDEWTTFRLSGPALEALATEPRAGPG
jgi:GNAT superfamily N-acetyltransferase